MSNCNGFYSAEHSMLRQELLNLKECQIKFLTLAVTATGVLLGLAASLAPIASLAIAYLFPLTILIPSWWVFFDKATTITRIVGYYRVLELAILEPSLVGRWLGWERALSTFRQMQEEGKLKLPPVVGSSGRVGHIVALVVLATTHRYWMLTYYTFFGLSALSLGMSLSSVNWASAGSGILAAQVPAALLVLASAVWNARVIWRLVWGRHSYTSNELIWKAILQVRDEQPT